MPLNKIFVCSLRYQIVKGKVMNMFNFNAVDYFPSGYKERGRFIQSSGVGWERRGCEHLGLAG